MVKLLKKQFDIKLIHTALIFALIYCVLFNSSVVLHKYAYSQESFFSTAFELSREFFYAYLAVFVFFFGFLINRFVFIIGSVLLFITGSVASYYLFYFDQAPTLKMMPFVYNAGIAEISASLSVKLAVWIIFSIAICFLGIKHFNPQNTKGFSFKILTILCLFLATNNIISPQIKVLRTYFPLQYLHNSYTYLAVRPEALKNDNRYQQNTKSH